jgi:hypothetical protein
VRAALELAGVIASNSPVEVSGTNQILAHARDHSLTENLEYTAAWNAAALQTNVRTSSTGTMNADDGASVPYTGHPRKPSRRQGARDTEVCGVEPKVQMGGPTGAAPRSPIPSLLVIRCVCPVGFAHTQRAAQLLEQFF